MSQIIPFETGKLPAKFAELFPIERLGTVGGGFPIISIKGKVFTRVDGDEREVIKRPGEDDPASSINVIILKQNPNDSKVYYTGSYSEGSDEKPTCYSNNGIAPEADAAEPQATKCAICPHNQWGSRITENGSKGKACADSRRIAVAALGLINDPMLIRVPAASLKPLGLYGDSLAKRQVPYQLAVTKVGFDYTVAHPALTFKAEGLVDENTAEQIVEILKDPVIDRILGITSDAPPLTAITSTPTPAPAPTPAPTPAPVDDAAEKAAAAKAAKLAEAKAAAARAAAELAALEAGTAEAPVAEPKVETKKAKATTAPLEVSGALASEIEGALANLNFDDGED